MLLLKPHFPGHDLDSPETTRLHRELIRTKSLLTRWYETQYDKYIAFAKNIPNGRHIELGSGGGFLKQRFPEVTTSSFLEEDVELGLVDRRLDAQAMDLNSNSVDSFFLLDVLHHLNDARSCLKELRRCLKPGAFALMIEPANTVLSRVIYKNFHHEGFDEKSETWGHAHAGPLAQANQAVPSIIFERDRKMFEQEFPDLKIVEMCKHTFMSYLVSGGLSYEQLIPSWAEPAVPTIERLATPLMPLVAQYMDVRLVNQQ